MQFLALTVAVAFATSAFAHLERDLTPREVEIRDREAHTRHLTARNCDGAAAAFHAKRKVEGRALKKRFEEERATPNPTVQAEALRYTTIQNWTCVTAPEVVEGPYYINNEIVRSDMTEDQAGVQLIIDVGVLDINTCQPIPDAFVEIWATNATGVYGAYPATLGGPPGGGGPGGPPPPGGGPGFSIPMERNETWLRGGLATNENGVAELVTVYPGYYQGRTAHIHAMIHLNYETSPNGTLVSQAGSVMHIGQFFFEESWNDEVYGQTPYNLNTNDRTYNSQDGILAQANTGGYNSFLDLERLGGSLSDGVLGYITVGVDSNAAYTIQNNNYLNSTGVDV